MTRDEARDIIESKLADSMLNVWLSPELVEVLVIVSRGEIAADDVSDALADAGYGESNEDAADIASGALNDLWALRLIRTTYQNGPWTLVA